MAVVSRDLPCPPEDVLRVLADGWNYATWVVGTSRIRGVDAEWPAPGSRIAHSAGLWPMVLQDVSVSRRWDPERGIELEAKGSFVGDANVAISVVPTAGGCRVRIAEDAVRGPARLVPEPLRDALISWRNRETLYRLGALACRPST
ncbi:hypothetical protein CELL_00121 [Cellulomonas sp. T2.31MG-18]|uniref:SRPBCC family protein n=1 Tax=Cellulomonas sp. T2.31MG-18 TaxID=3157619 RepID=UPI0035F02070